MSEIENKYNNFIENFQRDLGKVDVDLALRTLYLEHRIPSGQKPKVEIYVCYKPGVDLQKKTIELGQTFPCLSTTTFKDNHLVPDCERVIKVECMTDLRTVHKLSQDDDIEHVHGSASLDSL
jgi:hypothetical protein